MIHRRWQALAAERWPDGLDMVQAPTGSGRWATVAWCAGLTVLLHRTRRTAAHRLAAIDATGCGHSCWGDHELVDLLAPAASSPAAELDRAARRIAHFAACSTCRIVFGGQAAKAAARRARASRRLSVPA